MWDLTLTHAFLKKSIPIAYEFFTYQRLPCI